MRKEKVSWKDGQILANEIDGLFIKVSAKDNMNIEKIFQCLTDEIIKAMVSGKRTVNEPIQHLEKE